MPQSNLPLIVESDELERHLERHDLLVVDLCDQPTHAMYHVAGAVHLEYQRTVMARPPAMGYCRTISNSATCCHRSV